jgi:hypothetical protein
MDPMSAAIMAGGSILGGGIQYYGAKQANEMTQASAREQMEQQERLSSTANQRAVQDLRAAGLNPMLAYQQGGASTPSGASYNARNEAEAAIGTALQLARLAADVRKTQAETSYVEQQAKNAGSKGAQMEFLAQPFHAGNAMIQKAKQYLWSK